MQARSQMLLFAIAIACAAAACGEKKEPAPAAAAEQPAPAAEQPAPAPAPAPPPPVVATADAAGIVHLTASDLMRFSATRIEAKAGQKIKIELKNMGVQPKIAMGHNLVVLKPGTDPIAFATNAMAAAASEYIPADGTWKAAILGHTKLLGPGESDQFELELAAGTYPFVCSFPGHVALMNGQLVVQ